jgi:Ni/Co efflux regulator RcnB
MTEKIELLSRRSAFSLFGLAAAFSLAVPVTLSALSDAEAQTAGMERRQGRREGRHERREDRREGRHERREDRREGRQDRRETRRGGGSKPESTGTGTGTK